MKSFLIVTALALFALPSFAEANTPQAPCTAYFGVLQYDPKAPGFFVAAMSSSQAKWLAKNGQKHYPGLCLSLEKAKYLIVWTTSTQVATTERTVQRTGQVSTSTTGYETGMFNTYGGLTTWGNYSGSFSSNSTSTYTYDEVVPVTTATDHCYIYVLKSVGATVWEDVRNKVSQPQAIFSTETFRPRPVPNQPDPSGATIIGYLLRKEPTARAFDASLKFIFERGAQATPVAALLPHEEKSGDLVAPTTQPKQTQVETPTGANIQNTKVHVTSTPDGGEVYVDGKFRGNTPSDILIPKGEHVVKVILHQKEWSRTVEITGGEIHLQADLVDEKSVARDAPTTEPERSQVATKQKAIEQMRRVANAIKQCPEQKAYQSERGVSKSYAGPPTNVEWDVIPSKTVRSPFQGVIEFTLPSRWAPPLWCSTPSNPLEEQACQDAIAEQAKEGPEWREEHYRYEFDVGSDAPELVKMLWVAKDRKNNTVTQEATPTAIDECWVAAAKSLNAPAQRVAASSSSETGGGSSSANLHVKPWNRTAIRAAFVELAASDRKDRIKLWYTLTNTTDGEYRIQNMSGITTAVSAHGKTDFLYAFNQGMISLEMPLIIPANGKIRAMLTVALQTDKSVPSDASDATVTIYKTDVMSFLRSKYSKMQGFVLMDEGTRYEIDFPAGAWSETVPFRD